MKKYIKELSLILVVSILFSFLPSATFAAALKIVAIKDLSASVYINQSYSLPATVDATMSDKTTQKVAVTWNPKTVDTSKTGTFVNKGTVKGYSKQVLLTLKVLPLPADWDEIKRALDLGVVPKEIQEDYNQTITYKQYCLMLTSMISKYDSSYLPAWKKLISTAGTSNDKMLREDGILAMSCAAVLMGANKFDGDIDTDLGISQQEMDRQMKQLSWNYKYFKDWDKVVYKDCNSNYIWGGVQFFAQKRSPVSLNAVYPYDYKAHSMHLNEPLTRHHAILAVLRFYESQHWKLNTDDTGEKLSFEKYKNMPELKNILSAADKRRDGILNSKTVIEKGDTFIAGKTYTGKAYYVSKKGDDKADGLTPQTAWTTIDKVNKAGLLPGDAVFFERGGVWRSVRLQSQKGVTYSAYGEGEKPKLYGSSENGSGAEKWKLYAKTKDGGSIWVYYRDMLDCSSIVFNGGEVWTTRNVPFWNGKAFVELKDRNTESIDSAVNNISIDIKTWLNKDYTTFSMASSELPSSLPAYADWHSSDTTFDMLSNKGPLYVRCDAGNPGEIYKEIEFLIPYCPFDGAATDCVIDNLCIMYSSYGGIMCGQNDGVTVQNSEVGWCGGRIASYLYEATTQNDKGHTTNMAGIQINGGCVTAGSSHCSFYNNYVHHAYQEGYSMETGIHNNDPTMTGTVIAGSLIEFCSQALLMCNWDNEADPNHCFADCAFTDNYVLFSGYETFGDRIYIIHDAAAFTSQGGPNMYKGSLKVSGNVFALATGRLIEIDNYSEEYGRIYSNNTYIQSMNRVWINLDYRRKKYFGNMNNIKEAIKTVLGDTTGNVIPLY